MNGIDQYYLLIVMLAVFGISSIILHIKAYQKLFNSLQSRRIVGGDFAPDWMSKLGALGCMGYIFRIKKEIGLAQLNDTEASHMRKAAVFYYVGTFTTFFAVCLMFWRIYGAS